jgi:hypothetical protein
MTSSVDAIESSVDAIQSSGDRKATRFGRRRCSCAPKERLCTRRMRSCERLGLTCRRQVAFCACPTSPCRVQRRFGRSNTRIVGMMTSSVDPTTGPGDSITRPALRCAARAPCASRDLVALSRFSLRGATSCKHLVCLHQLGEGIKEAQVRLGLRPALAIRTWECRQFNRPPLAGAREQHAANGRDFRNRSRGTCA